MLNRLQFIFFAIRRAYMLYEASLVYIQQLNVLLKKRKKQLNVLIDFILFAHNELVGRFKFSSLHQKKLNNIIDDKALKKMLWS